MALAGLDLGRDPGRDLGVVDVVDGDVDPDLLAPVLGEGSNQLSWLGTKWLQSRIFRSPESLVLGSVKLTDGAWPAASSPPPGPPPPGSLVQAAIAAPMPATPTARRN